MWLTSRTFESVPDWPHYIHFIRRRGPEVFSEGFCLHGNPASFLNLDDKLQRLEVLERFWNGSFKHRRKSYSLRTCLETINWGGLCNKQNSGSKPLERI